MIEAIRLNCVIVFTVISLASLNLDIRFDGADRVAISKRLCPLDPLTTIRTIGLDHGLFTEPLTAANRNKLSQSTGGDATLHICCLCQQHVETRGTPYGATTGSSKPGNGGLEGFSNGASSSLI